MRTRGFITTIGSDIPSVIPIIVGLMTFFLAFASAFYTLNRTDMLISLSNDAIGVGQAFVEDGLLTPDEFEYVCNNLTKVNARFYACVDEEREGFCENPVQECGERAPSSRYFLRLTLPVAYGTGFYTPHYLRVEVWR